MADALEAMRQDMKEKPSEKFDGLQRHGALPIPPLVVFPPKRHLAVATGQQPPIGDGHPMGVAGEVAEHLLRPSQWRLGVDHPLRLLQGREELAPGRWSTPALALSLEAEAILGSGLPQRRQERPPE